MNEKRAIAHSTIYQFLGKGVSIGLGIFATALVMRYLGVAGFGDYSTILALMGLFSTLADLGLYMYLVTEISREGADTNRLTGNVFGLRIVVSVAGLAIGLLVVFAIPAYHGQIFLGSVIVAASFFFISAGQLLVAVFQKQLKTLAVAVAEIVGRVVLIGGVVAVYYLGGGLIGVLIAVVAGSAANFVLMYIVAAKKVDIKPKFEKAFWKEILLVSWPVGVTVVLNLIYFKIDTIFLSIMKGSEDTGIYTSAYKILEVLVAFPAIFAGLLTPLFSRHAFADPARFKNVLQRGFDYMLIGALPLAIGTQFLATDIMVLVGGREYAVAGPVLQILIIAVAIIFIGHLFANAVVALKLQRKIVWGYAIAAVTAVVANWIFIPPYSYFGAAWTTVAVECLVMAINIVVVSALLGKKTGVGFWRSLPSLRLVPKLLFANAVMVAVILALPPVVATWLGVDFSILVRVAVAGGCYVVMIFSIGVIKKEDIASIMKKKA